MFTELNDLLTAKAIDIITDLQPLSNKTYSSAMIEGRLATEIAKIRGTVKNIKEAVEEFIGEEIDDGEADFDHILIPYEDIDGKPCINDVELIGNKTSADLNMYTKSEIDEMIGDIQAALHAINTTGVTP